MNDTLNLSLEELQDRLKYFAARARYLSGMTLVRGADGSLSKAPIGATVSKYFEDLLKASGDPEAMRQRNEFLARAASDPVAKAQLCAIRIEAFNNYIFASQNIIDFFFEVVTLKPDERPVFQNTTLNEVDVYYVGQDGEAAMAKVQRDDQFDLKNLHYMTTDKVRYRVMDLYRGSIVDSALQTLRLSYDWKNKAEAKAFTLLDGSAFSAFTFTGKKQNYPYLANSRINKANLPTTNDIVVPGTNAGTNFGFQVLDSIVDYGVRWAGSDPDGDIRPTGRILVPGADVSGIGKQINPSGAKTTDQAQGVLDKGWTGTSYLNVNWVFIPDNTLTPGTCYPEWNRKPGRMYTKPSMDQEKVITNTELEEKNEEERYMRKVVGFEINSASRRFIARFKFRA